MASLALFFFAPVAQRCGLGSTPAQAVGGASKHLCSAPLLTPFLERFSAFCARFGALLARLLARLWHGKPVYWCQLEHSVTPRVHSRSEDDDQDSLIDVPLASARGIWYETNLAQRGIPSPIVESGRICMQGACLEILARLLDMLDADKGKRRGQL